MYVRGFFINLHPVAEHNHDILGKKVHNRDRIRRMSGEYIVETTQPSSLKKPKKVKMHYRMSLERMSPSAVKHSHNPWKMEAEVIEPLPMRFKTEGEDAYYMDQHGTWIKIGQAFAGIHAVGKVHAHAKPPRTRVVKPGMHFL